MLCPKCNHTVDDSANFCQNCGYRFPKENTPPPETKYIPVSQENLKLGADASEELQNRYENSVNINNERVAKMNMSRYFIVGGIAACAFLLILVIVLSFFF
jgi:hypothetical protein